MKRRRFFKTVAAAPAATVLFAQQTPAPAPGFRGGGPVEAPKLETAVADDAAATITSFFTPPQLAALRRVSALLMPASNGMPGAVEAGAPEFLDFLIGESPDDRKALYRAGLDALNAQAKKRFGKLYADLDDAQSSDLLAPLRQPWTYDEPADPLARFLRAAKSDVRAATMNSREYNAAAAPSGQRRFGGSGLYWYPLD